MLFNSIEFIFLFLPITLSLCFLLAKIQRNNSKSLALFWLILASLFFYAWWNFKGVFLILSSVAINYSIGYALSQENLNIRIPRNAILFLGIFINLSLLVYFKYTNFLISNLNDGLGLNIQSASIILPLAVSFFTFQQIEYLVDTYRGNTRNHDFKRYIFFVVFFPQLIAGPIVSHSNIIPQTYEKEFCHFNRNKFSVGLTTFVIGLSKKVIIADSIASFANLAFNAAQQGVVLTFSEAWTGAISYTLQLYFDFSGYSDMAIGLAYMVGIRLPINFYSPYKAISIIDFWRRWHITLSHFLRNYLYIPLGGNRKGKPRQYLNLMATMTLGGLWHGAGWTFVIWGMLHGIYLVINHSCLTLRQSLGHNLEQDGKLIRGLGWSLTFIAVVASWVIFRANSLGAAQSILSSMAGFHGVQFPGFLENHLRFLRDFGVSFDGFTVNVGISQKYAVFGSLFLLAVVWWMPNTYQWLNQHSPVFDRENGAMQDRGQERTANRRISKFFEWQPNPLWSAIVGIITAVNLLCFNRVSEFLYFQF